MSSNVGLSTPRGSGTSGYVQRNLSLLKPRAAGAGQPYTLESSTRQPPRVRKPDQDILKHDKLREIEVQVAELRDRLEEEGKMEEDELDEECDRLREKLVRDLESGKGKKSGRAGGSKTKSYQVHELAEAKARESEKLRRALGLKGETGDGGGVDGESEHPMARQERRRREAEIARVKKEEEHGRDEKGVDEDEHENAGYRKERHSRRRYSDDWV